MDYWNEVEPEVTDFEAEKPKLVEFEKAKPENKSFKEDGCAHKDAAAYDFTHIDKLLAKMKTHEEKIAWLKAFLKQLQETQKAMMFNSWGYATTMAIEDHYKSMTPYIQTVVLGIRAVQKKIQLLNENRVKSKYPAKY